ncbi:hypothetical protein [Engelhardtia mirabilis]|uniref:Uncharacterized protein n=1 Tax=Engelhardtia mirabilis TaxID=2528011 RepID=A0A518BQR2_9BACT|nr:hypothetical protein Pla133_44240 [Planctomycetes bacterium Pla133]QDV03631.1 hypothetical protein Pla86_44220 [Planctomycetes bacterium Pla86]
MSVLLPCLIAVTQISAAPVLSVENPGFGSSSDPSTGPWFGLALGQDHDFVVRTQPGAPVVFVASTGAPTGLGFEGQPLAVDLASAFVFGAATADGAGQARLGLSVPTTLGVGTPLWTQAAAIDPLGFTASLSNGLEHEFTDLAFNVVVEGFKSQHPAAFTAPSTLLLTDDAAWQAFWFQHNPFVPAPTVDFTRDVVYASFGGLTLSSGYSHHVDALIPIGGGVRVESTQFTPGLGCAVLFTQQGPFQFVAVDRAAAGATLVNQTTQTQKPPCP